MLRRTSSLPFSLSLSIAFTLLQTFLTFHQHNLLFVESAAWGYYPTCTDITIEGEPNQFCYDGFGFSPSPAFYAETQTTVMEGPWMYEFNLYDSSESDGSIIPCAPSTNVVVDIEALDEDFISCTITVDDIQCLSCSICATDEVSADCTNIPEGQNVPCTRLGYGEEYHPSYGEVSPLLPFTWQPLSKDFVACPDSGDFDDPPGVVLPSCFSSEVTLFAQGKGKKKISEIEVGDEVLVGEGNFRPVYSIDHKNTTKATHFWQFFCTHDEEPLEMTGQHMLFLKGEIDPIPANRVEVGDELQTIQGSCLVDDINIVAREGIFNVLTSSGTVIANGIISSTYSDNFRSNDGWIKILGYKIITQQRLFEVLLKPYSQVCTGISSKFCKPKSDSERAAIFQVAVEILKHWSTQTEGQQIVSLCFIIGAAGVLNILFNFRVLISTVIFSVKALQWKEANNGKNTKKKINTE